MRRTTKDLILRTVTERDLREIARMWAYPKQISPEEARTALEKMENAHRKNRPMAIVHLCLAVFRREDPRRIIGWCGLDGKAEAGKTVLFYVIDEAYRRRGYATQCAEALLRYAFEEMSYDRIFGGCAKDNYGSRRVMEKVGMKQDGCTENGDPTFSIDQTTFSHKKASFPQRVYALVARIPQGKVATYGLLALLLGSPRASRIVGAAMARAPEDLPCHRVLYADGSLCCPDAFGGQEIQRQMLLNEGVPFLPDGRVDLRECLWDGENGTDEQ